MKPSTLSPSPQIAFSVQTGMLTSLCAIASLISVSHHFSQTPSVFLMHPLRNTDIPLSRHFHIHLLLFPAGAMCVRTWSRWRYTYLISVYCNSLLATLNVRNAIRGRGHDDLGISLRPIDVSDSNTSTVDNHKVVGSGSVVPAVPLVSYCC